MRRDDRIKNMKLANKRLLSESHADTDNEKKEYIKSAINNLSSDDLKKIYDMVERCDPNYKK